jgi:hypothetical protein
MRLTVVVLRLHASNLDEVLIKEKTKFDFMARGCPVAFTPSAITLLFAACGWAATWAEIIPLNLNAIMSA